MYDVIKRRRSVRKYKPGLISEKDIEKIIDAGRLAPSANNAQPWEFVVCDDRQIKNKLSELCRWGKFIKDAASAIAVFGDKNNTSTPLDCAAATENMLIMATALSIGSCWVAGYKKPHSEHIKSLLCVPDDYELVSIVVLGYSDIIPKMHDKRSFASVYHHNKF